MAIKKNFWKVGIEYYSTLINDGKLRPATMVVQADTATEAIETAVMTARSKGYDRAVYDGKKLVQIENRHLTKIL